MFVLLYDFAGCGSKYRPVPSTGITKVDAVILVSSCDRKDSTREAIETVRVSFLGGGGIGELMRLIRLLSGGSATQMLPLVHHDELHLYLEFLTNLISRTLLYDVCLVLGLICSWCSY